MNILYIFPHPDDESFGPAAAIHQQIAEGHQVHLLTLTKGEATKMRFKYNYSKEEMGEVRMKEMEAVEKYLGLSSMTILDYADGYMKEQDPRVFEKIVADKIKEVGANIVVTYAVHGISGHHDHLVIHPVVKRVFCELKETFEPLKRLALLTLPDPDDDESMGGMHNVNTSKSEFIDCILHLSETNRKAMKESLYLYETFIEVIEETQVVNRIGDRLYFEFFGEDFNPPLKSMTDQL